MYEIAANVRKVFSIPIVTSKILNIDFLYLALVGSGETVPCNVCCQFNGQVKLFANSFQTLIHFSDYLVNPVPLLLFRFMEGRQDRE